MSDTLREKLAAFDPELPLERARTVPAAWYRDGDVYEAERRTVFGRAWLAVGRADLVAAPGSFLTETVAGEPVLVVRDRDGTLRAFHNVCRHRAAPVESRESGTASVLRCPYHGWTYDLAGQLRGTPEFDGVADFCREENGLPPLEAAAWGPFVWVHAPPVTVPLEEHLAPLPRQLAGLGMEKLRWAGHRRYEVACNWKVFVDNYLDGGYHVHAVHPGLAGVLDYTRYRTEIAPFTSSQISPLRAPGGADAGVGQVRSGDNAYYCWVFPNVMLNVYGGYMDTNLVVPTGPDSCRVTYEFYFEDVGAAARAHIEQSINVAEQIQFEDARICEAVQRGLASRSFEAGRYSVRREAAVHAFHRLLARFLGGERGA